MLSLVWHSVTDWDKARHDPRLLMTVTLSKSDMPVSEQRAQSLLFQWI
jgi:hypothetical protein